MTTGGAHTRKRGGGQRKPRCLDDNFSSDAYGGDEETQIAKALAASMEGDDDSNNDGSQGVVIALAVLLALAVLAIIAIFVLFNVTSKVSARPSAAEAAAEATNPVTEAAGAEMQVSLLGT